MVKPDSERNPDRNQNATLPTASSGVFLCVSLHAKERRDRRAMPRWRRMNEGAEAKEKVKATAAVVGGEVGRAERGSEEMCLDSEQKCGCP